MEISLSNIKTNFSKIIQSLIDGKESVIYITKYGKPIAQMTLVKETNERVGIAKKDMERFDLSLEDFNSIPIDGFN